MADERVLTSVSKEIRFANHHRRGLARTQRRGRRVCLHRDRHNVLRDNTAISSDGSIIAFGAPTASAGSAFESGEVFVATETNGTWALTGTDTEANPPPTMTWAAATNRSPSRATARRSWPVPA
jgi:hypothetical protein